MDEMMNLQGNWMNRFTGEVIHVRNSIIDGDHMIIMTNVGQMSGEEFMKNYIQASDEIYDERGKVIGKEKLTIQPVSTQNQSKVETINDQDYLIDDKPVKFDTEVQTTIHAQKKVQITNIDLIKKVFNKIESKPEIKVDIKWDDFPKEQISTLVKFLDVNVDDIAQYLCAEYVNVDSVKTQIIDIINKNI